MGSEVEPEPFQRRLPIWGLLFPDPNDPHCHWFLARSRLLTRGQERQRPTGELELSRTPRMSMPGWQLERTARLARPGPGLGQRIADRCVVALHTPVLGRPDQKMGLRQAACLEKGEHIRPPISNVDPGAAWIRGSNGLHLAHPDVGFALRSLVSLRPAFSFGSGNTHKGFLRDAPQHLSGGRMHRQHRLEKKSPPAFIADLAHAADGATMRQINVGRILHQQAHGRSSRVCSGLMKVRLHQGRKGDIRLAQQSIQGFGRFPGLHLGRQRTQGILRQTGGRLNRSPRSTQITQADAAKGSLGPALGVQHCLYSHPIC